MAFTLDTTVGLGRSKAGLTLAARLVDSDGADLTAIITVGFTEIGEGWYIWHYEAYPDSFRGGVKFFESGVPGDILGLTTINPEEIHQGGADGEITIDVGHSDATLNVDSVVPQITNTGIQVTTGVK